MDVEWDFDLDTGAKKFTSNNVLVDVHEGNIFAGLSYARLNAPGRFFTEGVSSSVSNFNQLRLLLGYGVADQGRAGRGGECGAGFEGRRSGWCSMGRCRAHITGTAADSAWSFGSTSWARCGMRTSERFNFTLVNIGTAGNLRRAASLF